MSHVVSSAQRYLRPSEDFRFANVLRRVLTRLEIQHITIFGMCLSGLFLGTLWGLYPNQQPQNILSYASPTMLGEANGLGAIREALAATLVARMNQKNSDDPTLQHREELLRITFDAWVAKLSPEERQLQQIELLRRELTLEQNQDKQSTSELHEQTAGHDGEHHSIVDLWVALSSQQFRRGSIGGFIGLVLGVALASFRRRKEQAYLISESVSDKLDMVRLGCIPRMNDLPPWLRRWRTYPETEVSPSGSDVRKSTTDIELHVTEAIRSAAFFTLIADWGKGKRSYVVCSPNPGDGKTTMVASLGIAFSQCKLRVALVDADLRNPSLNQLFGIDNDFGLRNILLGEVDSELTSPDLLTRETTFPNVRVLTAGEGAGNPHDMLRSPRLANLLYRLRSSFDLVLIDTSAMLCSTDAQVIAAQSDAAVLVLGAHQTTQRQALAARDMLRSQRVPCGVILNGCYSPGY